MRISDLSSDVCSSDLSCNFSGEAIQRHARKRAPDCSVDRAPVRANAAIFLKRAFMARFFNAGGHGDGAFDRFDNIRKAYTCGGPGEGKAADGPPCGFQQANACKPIGRAHVCTTVTKALLVTWPMIAQN